MLQNIVLNAFRNLLSSSPLSLEVFREEGIWDLIFSENFFYFESASDETVAQIFSFSEEKFELFSGSSSTSNTAKVSGVNSLQMEVISFVEFAATSNGNAHNMVGSFFHPFLDVCVCVLNFFYPVKLRLKNRLHVHCEHFLFRLFFICLK